MRTFHLPMGEIDLPPIDLFMMTGLSIDDMPPPSSDDFDPELVARCIGPQLMAYNKGTKGVLPSWFKEYQGPQLMAYYKGYELDPTGRDFLLHPHLPGVHANPLHLL